MTEIKTEMNEQQTTHSAGFYQALLWAVVDKHGGGLMTPDADRTVTVSLKDFDARAGGGSLFFDLNPETAVVSITARTSRQTND